MNYEQKLAAMAALLGGVARIFLVMRSPGDWYVSSSMSHEDGRCVVQESGHGKTPQEAIEKHWEIYGTGAVVRCDHVSADGRVEKRVRWNGFMWADAGKGAG